LMLHGWSVDHRLMKGCMEPVFKKMDTEWKRIYFDLPGMGRTKGESEQDVLFTETVKEWLSRVAVEID
jgi:pimeloyl-ACP methyl ester carboxylesterase